MRRTGPFPQGFHLGPAMQDHLDVLPSRRASWGQSGTQPAVGPSRFFFAYHPAVRTGPSHSGTIHPFYS